MDEKVVELQSLVKELREKFEQKEQACTPRPNLRNSKQK